MPTCIWAFKLGNGEGGKNRWFGRRRDDLRAANAASELMLELRRAWHGLFPEVLETHPTLGGEWLVLAQVSLDDLKPGAGLNRRMALKTLLFQQLAQALVVAEKLRDESFSGLQTQVEGQVIPAQPQCSLFAFSLHPLNQILYGPPGTGKTYATAAWALALVENRPFAEVEARYHHDHRTLHRLLDTCKARKQVRFVTCHQSFSYEKFVEGINPDLNGEGGVSYTVAPGVFRLVAAEAYEAWQRATVPVSDEAAPARLPFSDVYTSYIADSLVRLEASVTGTVEIPTVGNYTAVITAV
jgi:hypothetical protein